VRVPELRRHVELELPVVLDRPIRHLQLILHDLLQQQRLQRWVQILPHILHQHGMPK
jgi:hypothetical protein